jgi:hypothetical protein
MGVLINHETDPMKELPPPDAVPGRVLIEEFENGARYDNRDGTCTAETWMAKTPVAPVSITSNASQFEAVGTKIRAEFRNTGDVVYRNSDALSQSVSLAPHTIGYDLAPNDVPQISPMSTVFSPSLNAGKLSLAQGFKGVPVRYESTDLAVSKVLTLDAAFLGGIPKTAKSVQFVWRVATTLPVISHELQGVLFGTSHSNRKVFRLDPLEARDAVGGYCPGRTEHYAGYVIGTLDAAWLRSAVAPVMVDPVVQAGVPTQDMCGGLNIPTFWFSPCKCFFLFTLPEVPGGPGMILSSSLRNIADYYASAVVADAGLTETVGWTEASNAATMDALTFGTVLGTTTIAAAYTWYYWNVLGDYTKGIIKAYNDSCAEATLILRGCNGTVTNVQSALDLQDAGNGAAREIGMRDRLNATSQPGLSVTYRTPRPFMIGGAKRF